MKNKMHVAKQIILENTEYFPCFAWKTMTEINKELLMSCH